MERTVTTTTLGRIGETVRLCGWVSTQRDHGGIVFLDLRDRWGIVQVVSSADVAGKVGTEWVITVTGVVKKRPEKLINSKIETGTIEIEAKEIEVLAESLTPPFPLDTSGLEVDEELRLKYRYLDLRRARMRQNLYLRNRVLKVIREYLWARDFWEVDTPILTKATPEGARDFIVPSRLQPGEFYALPQSPQQYKQLLMVAGVERYFQIARCFRDEDPRADRAYGEFTQLDLEMSFITQEEIRDLIEELFTKIVKEIFPAKKILKAPFPVLTYAEAMKKYGSDKPDLRENKNDPDELAFCWVVDFPLFEWKERENRWDAMHHPFTAPKPEDIDFLYTGDSKEFGRLRADQYDFVLNGYEIGGGSIRIADPKLQTRIFEILGHSKEDIEKKFGHLLTAFKYGVPPHGGIAPGIDRFLMAVLDEPSVREVIAFPTSASGQTAVMGAPSKVDAGQLQELGIKIAKK